MSEEAIERFNKVFRSLSGKDAKLYYWHPFEIYEKLLPTEQDVFDWVSLYAFPSHEKDDDGNKITVFKIPKTKQEFCLSRSFFFFLKSKMAASSGESFMHMCFAIYPHILDYIFDVNINDPDGVRIDLGINEIRATVMTEGFVPSIDTFDNFINSNHSKLAELSAEACSIETLRKNKQHPNRKVRKIIYDRLGVGECLDLMLADKCTANRRHGVILAPIHYSKLDDMIAERSPDVFCDLVYKVSPEVAPLLLANKNYDSDFIKEKLKFRLSYLRESKRRNND